MYDVIIVGMGPAGMSAGIYAKRSGMNTLILEKSAPGGLLNQTSLVDNYLGFSAVSGSELAISMFNHINKLGVPFKSEEVTSILDKGDYKEVITTKNTYQTRAVILSAGRKAKTVLKNEEKYLGKGLSYCAVCDAAFYKGKDVAIIGSGNSAFEEGLYLTDFVNKLYILSRKDTLRADEHLIEKMKEKNNVEILYETTVSDVILDDNRISALETNKGTLKVEGLFIYAGYTASTHYLKDLDIKTDNGYIVVDENMRTNIKGIYAAGDAIKKSLYQIITAASEGSIAATSAKKDLPKEK